MNEHKNRPTPLKIQRFKGRITNQHHNQDESAGENMLLKCLLNLGQPNPQNSDNSNIVNKHVETGTQKNFKSSQSIASSEHRIENAKSGLSAKHSRMETKIQDSTSSGFKIIKISCTEQEDINSHTTFKKTGTFNNSSRSIESGFKSVEQETLKKSTGASKVQKQFKMKDLLQGSTKVQDSFELSSEISKQKIPTDEINQSKGSHSMLPIDSNVKRTPPPSKTRIENVAMARTVPYPNTPDIKPKQLKKHGNVQTITHKNQTPDNQGASPTLIQQNRYKTQQLIPDSDAKEELPKNDEAQNFIIQLFQSFNTPKNKDKNMENEDLIEQPGFGHNKSANSILKLVAHLGSNKSNQKLEKLKNVMKNQKNLKLKDYLRLTSLSNDSKFDRYSKSLKKDKQSAKNNFLEVKQNQNTINMKKSYLFNKNKTVIDSQKSIALIKVSLDRKLDKLLESALKVFSEVQQSKNLIGKEYEDLVFMCNFHRVFDENLFKASELLEDLLKQFQDKREIKQALANRQLLTESKVIEMMSPKKKKKKTQSIDFGLIQRILLGFNIIQDEDICNDEIKQDWYKQ